MKKNFLLTLLFCLSLFISNGQINTPQASPMCEISQSVGVSNVSITYNRPGVKNRIIFGDLVPYDKMWRTGANKATKVTFSKDVKVGGKDLPAGDYSLFTIPSEKEWTIIFNKELNLWGTGDYKQDKDALRINVPSETLEKSIESFTIDFGSFTPSGAELILSWENTRVVIQITTNAVEEVQKEYTALLESGPDANTYYRGARFFLDNDLDMTLALKWIDLAIKKRPEAFWMLYQKARILVKLENIKEAIKVAEKTIEMAEAADDSYGYDNKAKALIKGLK